MAKYTKSKKRKVRLLIFVMFAFVIIFGVGGNFGVYGGDLTDPSVRASSKETQGDRSWEEVREELFGNINNNLNRINLSEWENFVNSIGGGNLEGGVREHIQKIIRGEVSGGADVLLRQLGRVMLQGVTGFLPIMLAIIILCMLSGFVSGMTGEFLKKQTKEIIFFVCFTVIILLVLSQVVSVIDTSRALIGNLALFMDIIFPILLTLMSALGGHVSVGAYQPLMAVLSSTMMSIISGLVIPLFIAATLFSIIGNMSETVKLEGFRNFFKTSASWIMGSAFALFTVFAGLQGVAGAAVDGVAINALRFAASSYVPILGGYLSDGFDLILGSIILIKNATGFTSILVLLSMILAPVVQIIIFILMLKLTAAIAEPIADRRISKMLSSLASNMKILLAAVLGVGFLFFIVVLLVMTTGNFV